jgi:hypothetical protein
MFRLLFATLFALVISFLPLPASADHGCCGIRARVGNIFPIFDRYEERGHRHRAVSSSGGSTGDNHSHGSTGGYSTGSTGGYSTGSTGGYSHGSSGGYSHGSTGGYAAAPEQPVRTAVRKTVKAVVAVPVAVVHRVGDLIREDDRHCPNGRCARR